MSDDESEAARERGLRRGLDRLALTLFEERDEARAERDRLRETLADINHALYPFEGVRAADTFTPDDFADLPRAITAIIAERDRLHAAIDDVRSQWRDHTEDLDDDDAREGWMRAWERFTQLDLDSRIDEREATDG